MEKDKERLKVIENIKQKLKEGKLNDKVELNDPIITEEERQKEIINFDIMRKNPIKKIKLKNFINTKSLIIDSDLDDIDLKINNTNETYRIHDGFPKKYPKFLKTKFKRDTILKFGSYKGIYFGSPV